MKKECPSCGLEINAKEHTCPYCNYEFPVTKAGYTFIAILLVIIMIVFLVLNLI